MGLQFHLETTPASARQLIAHCGHEIVEGRYIQTAQEMLAGVRRFDTVNTVMHGLLDRLTAVATADAGAP
jgi:hypothetical protein